MHWPRLLSDRFRPGPAAPTIADQLETLRRRAEPWALALADRLLAQPRKMPAELVGEAVRLLLAIEAEAARGPLLLVERDDGAEAWVPAARVADVTTAGWRTALRPRASDGALVAQLRRAAP